MANNFVESDTCVNMTLKLNICIIKSHHQRFILLPDLEFLIQTRFSLKLSPICQIYNKPLSIQVMFYRLILLGLVMLFISKSGYSIPSTNRRHAVI